MEKQFEAAARLNRVRGIGGGSRSQFRQAPHPSYHHHHHHQSARVLTEMKMASNYHVDNFGLEADATLRHTNREFVVPLQPLNLNRPSIEDGTEKKPVTRNDYGYKPTHILEDEPQPLQAEMTIPVDREPPQSYPYSRPYYPRRSYYLDEDRFYSGYLDDDFDEIVIPPPPGPRGSHQFGPPPPPTPPPMYSHPHGYEAAPPGSHHYPSPYYRSLPAYTPESRRTPIHEVPPVTPPEELRPATPSSPGDLQELDIVTGRGAPTNYHYGNQVFRDLISENATEYLCAKRSAKPQVAMKILDVLKDRGARFVKREKTAGRFTWVEIDSKSAYERVCQELRSMSDVSRQALAVASIKKKAVRFQNHEQGGQGEA